VVVVDKSTDFLEDIKKAEGLKIPVVSFEFVNQSIKDKARSNTENHKVGADTDVNPLLKKQKMDETSGIHKDSEWMGVSIGSDTSVYPFVLEITEMNGVDFNGCIKWPTLGKGAVTKVKGTVKGDQVKFEEYKAITGVDDVELPMYYTGKLTGDKLNGKLNDSSGEESTFSLSKIKTKSGITTSVAAPAKDLSQYKGLPSLKAKSALKGVLTLDYNFTVKLTSLTSEGKVEGTITWPSVTAETKFVGTVIDNDIVFEETEVLKGDGIEIPVKYEGKIDETAKSATGLYDAPMSKGSFVLLEPTK